jgi:hypothetical protein
MPSAKTPLFVHSNDLSQRGRRVGVLGEWRLNPDVLTLSCGADPNSGQGLDLAELKALIHELGAIQKRLGRELHKRGRKPQTLIGRCGELFLKHYRPELDIKTVWARVRVVLRREKLLREDADWDKLRNAAKRRMKRESTYPAVK